MLDMICAACGAELPPGAKFCLECGQAQQTACRQCGTTLPTGAKFCSECGTATGAPAATASAVAAVAAGPSTASERRVCSVLFADLVGFTPLSEARDPEEVRELLSRYFDVARTIVERHGGVVEKFIGDAVMAVWGTPVTTEQDAERAVRAGLELVGAVTTLGAEANVPGLAARAGVVTGEVAATLGAVGEGMVAGDAVNTAARVQAAATAGSVYADEATRRLAAAAVEFADAGAHVLKGKSEPEHLWRATTVVATVGGVQRVDGLEAALVGRDAEIRLVKELFHAAADRRTPRLLVVAGAAGVGKSRLGWEFDKYIDGLKQVVFWHRGRCLSYGEGVAFWALAEAVRQRLGIVEDDPTATATDKMVNGLAEIVTDADERAYVSARLARLLGLPSDADGPLGREELFAGWRIFFERLAETSPVVLLIEDAQHADAGLLDFLDHLVDWARDLPIFVLVLTRPELEQRRAGFGVGRNRTVLTLDPLDPASMSTLVESLVPGIPAQARDAITTHAQGVPLFAVETVRSLVDKDIVQPIDGVYRLVGDVGELAVPDSLHALLAARLDLLDPPVRALVADAAVLGTSFPADALVAVSDQTEDAVRAGLAELLRREVLEISTDRLSPQRGDYRFTQHLLRQVAYDTLSRRDRKARHLAVAAHLRTTFPDDGEEVADAIARHYRDALNAVPDDGDVTEIRGQAMRMWIRSADRALRAGAPSVAAGAYATAAELATENDHRDDAAAASCWERAARAAQTAGDFEIGAAYAGRAHALHEAAGRVRDAARAQTLAGQNLRLMGRYKAARDKLTAAVDVLRADPDADTVHALSQLAMLELFDSTPAGDALTAEALGLGQALDVGDTRLSDLLIGRGLAHSIAGRTIEAAAALDYAARLAARGGDNFSHGRALLNLADVLAGFDPETAADAARAGTELLRRVGARNYLGVAASNLVEVYLCTGRWDTAADVLAAALGPDGLDDVRYIRIQQGRLAALRGDRTTARQAIEFLAGQSSSEDPQDIAALLLLEADAAFAAGDVRTALERGRRVVELRHALGIHHETARWAWPVAARSAHDLGDHEAERALLQVLDGYAVGRLPLVLRAQRDLVTARLAAVSNGGANTAELYERAVAALRRIPDPYHLAYALLDHADYLGRSNDVAAADDAIREATKIAESLGAEPLARRAAQAQLQHSDDLGDLARDSPPSRPTCRVDGPP